MPNSIVAIFAHPDDEILACGASLAKHASTGAVVRILLLASGLTARGPVATSAMDELHDHARRAADVIGAESVMFGEFPDNRMDTVPLLDVVQVIEEFLGDMTPEILYTHNDTDLNIDHQKTFDAVTTASRPLGKNKIKNILTFENPSSTEWNLKGGSFHFNPNTFISIDENNLQKKVDAMEKYSFEKRSFPHPRSPESLRNLASYRGNIVGEKFAEALMLIRSIS